MDSTLTVASRTGLRQRLRSLLPLILHVLVNQVTPRAITLQDWFSSEYWGDEVRARPCGRPNPAARKSSVDRAAVPGRCVGMARLGAAERLPDARTSVAAPTPKSLTYTEHDGETLSYVLRWLMFVKTPVQP